MKTFRISITVNDNGHPSFDFDPKIPFQLSDKIKEVVNDFYK